MLSVPGFDAFFVLFELRSNNKVESVCRLSPDSIYFYCPIIFSSKTLNFFKRINNLINWGQEI